MHLWDCLGEGCCGEVYRVLLWGGYGGDCGDGRALFGGNTCGVVFGELRVIEGGGVSCGVQSWAGGTDGHLWDVSLGRLHGEEGALVGRGWGIVVMGGLCLWGTLVEFCSGGIM